jgi:hypothetical protein
MPFRRLIVSVLACLCCGAMAGGASAATVAFGSTGGQQTFTVPAGVSRVHVVAVGGRGGANSSPSSYSAPGGFGAIAQADLSVTSGEVLYVEVAGNGSPGDSAGAPGKAGFGGGGTGGPGAGGGGGASDVRTVSAALSGSFSSRLIVAGGGGGGAGSPGGGNAGAGGPVSGGGGPGTATAGGAGGMPNGQAQPGSSGMLGLGGSGGAGSQQSGAGGGGGVYGGGGGGGGGDICSPAYGCVGEPGGNGGGGSSGFAQSVANPALATDTTGMPSVTITYLPPRGSATVGKPRVRGTTARILLGCRGHAGVTCDLTTTLSITETLKNGRVVAIAAQRARRKAVLLGEANRTLAAGRRVTVRIGLNKRGRRLLARFHLVRARLVVTQVGSSGKVSVAAAKTVTFRTRPK